MEDAALAGLADLVGVEKLELASAFIVAVLDADAAVPRLNFAFACPESDVYWVGAVHTKRCSLVASNQRCVLSYPCNDLIQVKLAKGDLICYLCSRVMNN